MGDLHITKDADADFDIMKSLFGGQGYHFESNKFQNPPPEDDYEPIEDPFRMLTDLQEAVKNGLTEFSGDVKSAAELQESYFREDDAKKKAHGLISNLKIANGDQPPTAAEFAAYVQQDLGDYLSALEELSDSSADEAVKLPDEYYPLL